MKENLLGKELFQKHKKTKHREKIIEILNLFELPAPAEDILVMFNYFRENISLSTIYRNLELLTAEGIVKKSLIINTNKARYELNRKKHSHYLICLKCGKMQPLECCPVNINEEQLDEKTGYKITGHKFEVYGYCPKCQE